MRHGTATVAIGRRKQYVRIDGSITARGYSSHHSLGVRADGLVVADEVVLDLARLADVVDRVPVYVDPRSTSDSLVDGVPDELVELHAIVPALRRRRTTNKFTTHGRRNTLEENFQKFLKTWKNTSLYRYYKSQ